MALELLNKQTVQIVDGSNLSWQDAIRKASQPLVDNGTVGTEYVDSMINVVEEKGPYINIGPNIALAHARPSSSCKKIGLALMKTNHVVNLTDENHPVTLWFVLAATDSTSHLGVIQKLSEVLMNGENVQRLLRATTVEEILKVFR